MSAVLAPVAFLIEFLGIPPCWLRQLSGSAAFSIGVTYTRSQARHFVSEMEAMHEICRLNLPTAWFVNKV
jgi:hypothetical protein